MPATNEIRIATYNVHGCVGRDRQTNPARVARVLRELRADIIGLQEVRFAHRRGQGQLAELSELTGLHAVASPLYATDEDWRGNGLLTRFPVEAVEHHDVSVARREPRGLLDVQLSTPHGSIRVIVVHFGLRIAERREQIDRLLERLHGRDVPLVAVVGDFNEWRPRAAALLRLHAHMGWAPAHRTFPAWLPVLALDRIWVDPASAVLAAGAHRSALARRASDHLPAWVDLRRD